MLGSDKVSDEMLALVDELASMSSKITVEKVELQRTPSFSVNRVGEDTWQLLLLVFHLDMNLLL